NAFSNLSKASENAVDISNQLNEMIKQDARPQINLLLVQSQDAIMNLNKAIINADQLMRKFSDSADKVDTVIEKANTAAIKADEMLGKLNEASTGVNELANDKQLHADLKATIRNAAEASNEAKQLLMEINRKFGTGKNKAQPVKSQNIPESGFRTTSIYNTTTDNIRLDASYTFGFNDKDFYRIGGYDLGETNKLNLQKGTLLDKYNSVRYGIYAGKVGLGYDYNFGKPIKISADLYDPNKVSLELKSLINITNDFELYSGLKGRLRDESPDLLFGIRYNK
ncbi:MAG: hypothetical protein SNJ70_02955, partial [Armatimonadota bacterium]